MDLKLHELGIACLLLPCLLAAASAAQDDSEEVVAPVTVTLLPAQPKSATPLPVGRAARHVFGGRDVKMTVRLEASSDEVVDVRLQMLQTTFATAAPIGDRVTVLSREPLAGGQPRDVEVVVSLPDVESETTIMVALEAKRAREDAWQDVETARLRVYPDDLLAPLSRWSRRVHLRLDTNGKLARFLTERDVRVVDLKAGALDPRVPAVTVLVTPSELALSQGTMRSRGAVIVLNEGFTTFPKIVVTREQASVSTVVDMKFLDDLDSDPRASKLLLEIFQMSNVLDS